MGSLKPISLIATVPSLLLAWGHQQFSEDAPPPSSEMLHYPLNTDQEWYVKESYLLWKPFEDDVDYADRLSLKTDLEFPLERDTLEHPHFEWSSGVRIALGKYLPKHDLWDLNFITTYYYTEAEDHTKANFEHDEAIDSLWLNRFLGIASSASANWKMNFFTWDMTIGRYYNLTPRIALHPFVGVRAALIYQDYVARYQGFFQDPQGKEELVPHKTSFKGSHDFWGAGPRIGTDFAFGFEHGWSFLAALSASFFYGRYALEERFHGIANVLSPPPFSLMLGPVRVKGRDADTMLRSNLEGTIGLGWEKWVRKHTVRIAPSFEIEASEWFSLKRWFSIHALSSTILPSNDTPLRSYRHYTDLGLWGFNFNLQIDW